MLIYVLSDPAPFYRIFATEFPGRRVSILDPVDYIINGLQKFFPDLEHSSAYDKERLGEIEIAPSLSLADAVNAIRSYVPITQYIGADYDILIVTNTTPYEQSTLYEGGAFLFGQDAEPADFGEMARLAEEHLQEYERRKDA